MKRWIWTYPDRAQGQDYYKWDRASDKERKKNLVHNKIFKILLIITEHKTSNMFCFLISEHGQIAYSWKIVVSHLIRTRWKTENQIKKDCLSIFNTHTRTAVFSKQPFPAHLQQRLDCSHLADTPAHWCMRDTFENFISQHTAQNTRSGAQPNPESP